MLPGPRAQADTRITNVHMAVDAPIYLAFVVRSNLYVVQIIIPESGGG